MNYFAIKKKFDDLGYVKIKILNKKIISNFKNCLATLILNKLDKLDKKFTNNKKINDVDYILNEGMLRLDKIHHEHLVDIYNQVPKTNFFNFLSNDNKILKLVTFLMFGKNRSYHPILRNSTTVRMDTPGLDKFYYGWHRDNNSNIPNSNFIQLWAPVVSDISKELGGLNIIEKSHLYNLETTHTKTEQERLKKNLPIRAKYNAKIKNNFFNLKERVITAKLGEVVLFKNSLMHKSGLNKSKSKIRYVMTTFYHDMMNPNWSFLNLDHKKSNLKY